MLVLHDNLTSGNGYKARLLLAQLGIAYRRIEYDIDRGETRTPEFLAKNLNGLRPDALSAGGRLAGPRRRPAGAHPDHPRVAHR
jgi:glutathione S-transferase